MSNVQRLKERYSIIRAIANDEDQDGIYRQKARAKADGILVALQYLNPELFNELNANQ